MKYFAPLFLIALFSLPLSAQIIKPAEKTSQETAEAWQDFMPAEEEFCLESPGIVTLRYTKTADDKLPPNRSYLTLVGGIYYFIFSDPIDKPFQNQMVSGFVKSQAADLQTDEIYSFDDEFGYHHTILAMKNAARIYTFQTVSLSKTNASVKRFFDSIRVKGNLQRPTEKTAVQNLPPIPASENGGISLACSTAPDSSLPPLPIAANSSSSGATTGVKTLARPRANYTDYARSYQIEGNVQVRATFLANGKMGMVSTVKSLPFGLAVQGLQAACGLTFEPATKDGVPYTTVKQIIYNFSLY